MTAQKPSTDTIIKRKPLTIGSVLAAARFVAPAIIVTGTVVVPLYVESVKSAAVSQANEYTDQRLRELKEDLKKDLERIDNKLDRITQYLMERKP